MSNYNCTIGDIEIEKKRIVLIAGPCMAESLDICQQVAERLAGICQGLDIDFVFKASFDKANRSSISGYRGPGIAQGLDWLGKIRDKLAIPVLTDIHEASQAKVVASVVDCIQIPAFLCRQTDLLLAAADTGVAINVKKGQFMAPWEMANVVEKVRSRGNDNVMLTERGTFFGYNRLVSDFRSIPQMQEYAPVIYDATHSVQQPGGLGTASGGERQYASMLSYAAIAVGADGIFIETHPDPDNALSDAGSQVALDDMEQVLSQMVAIHQAVANKVDPGVCGE